jgi:hypothetical protein
MTTYRVTLGLHTDDDSPWTDIVEMSKAEANTLRAEGAVMLGQDADLYQFDVEEVPVFDVASWRDCYGELITLSPGDGDPL